MDDVLLERVRALLAQEPTAGYRALHARLKEEPDFQQVGLKKVQTAVQHVRGEASVESTAPARPSAGPGENLWSAASDGDIGRVEALMTIEGMSPTSPDENGYTPIHAASSWGREQLLRLLLERDGAAANVLDNDGDTPLHHVAGASELEEDILRPIVKLLLDHRADPEIQNHEGKTCLDVCGEGALADEEEEAGEVNLMFVRVLAEHGYKVPESPEADEVMAAMA
mmetsp:Transcript_61007/g.134208  ORF Transcript_61007/g.134208 Transcript_61007/m.134208 type:complete len:226 (-) Transcript_61007:138-815(-)